MALLLRRLSACETDATRSSGVAVWVIYVTKMFCLHNVDLYSWHRIIR